MQVAVTVEAPLEKCYRVWADRINYCQWFNLIQEARACSRGSVPSALRLDDLFLCLPFFVSLPHSR